jgi:site-specific recombinase XerD
MLSTVQVINKFSALDLRHTFLNHILKEGLTLKKTHNICVTSQLSINEMLK